MRSALLLLAVLGALSPASALVRMGVFIGNNAGLLDERPLRFAARDAEAVHKTLLQLGGLDAGEGVLVLNQDADKVMIRLEETHRRVEAIRRKGEKVQLLVYYSGHGSESALHVNGRKLSLDRIRALFKDNAADLKILIADACFSGSLIQAKGADLGETIPVKLQDDLKVNGSAILTSSSSGELSQESADLQGSLFTHYFLTALRGAGDADRDGAVSLWEAYHHTRASLRRKFASARRALQNPEFEVDVRGSENVVLTRLDRGQAVLSMRGLPQGDYRVLEAMSATQVAEFTLLDTAGVDLALPRSLYLVYQVADQAGRACHADLRSARRLDLRSRDFRPMASEGLAAKGLLGAETVGRLDRGDWRLGLQPRYYPSFPGREASATALEIGLQRNLGDFGLSLGLGWLTPYRDSEGGYAYRQQGYSLSADLRYYWSYSRWGALFAGPRGEFWTLSQSVNGEDFPSGRMAGTLVSFGFERSFLGRFALQAAFDPGYLWRYDTRGDLRSDLVFPITFSLRAGP
jgi:hypothetical protein